MTLDPWAVMQRPKEPVRPRNARGEKADAKRRAMVAYWRAVYEAISGWDEERWAHAEHAYDFFPLQPVSDQGSWRDRNWSRRTNRQVAGRPRLIPDDAAIVIFLRWGFDPDTPFRHLGPAYRFLDERNIARPTAPTMQRIACGMQGYCWLHGVRDYVLDQSKPWPCGIAFSKYLEDAGWPVPERYHQPGGHFHTMTMYGLTTQEFEAWVENADRFARMNEPNGPAAHAIRLGAQLPEYPG